MQKTCAPGRGVLKHYAFPLILLGSITLGSASGFFLKDRAAMVKPLGDIFLNLLFTAVVPLVFFSIASSVAAMTDLRKLGRILLWMLLLFAATGILSTVLMLVGVKLFPPMTAPVALASAPAPVEGSVDFVGAFTVKDFSDLLSKKNMLPLIFFSMLVGLASCSLGEKSRPFSEFLAAGSEVMVKVIGLIMLYAPVGLAAYFAYLTGVFGPQLMQSYLRAVLLYYPFSIAYFFLGFSAYAWLAGGREGFKRFWSKIPLASMTALGTGSSMATVPVNLQAADEIGVPKEISRIAIPVGATIHMDGTCLSGILKIAILFSFYGRPFSGLATYATAVGVGVLSGVVMIGIPGGGFLGELLIVTLYGFPPESLPIITMVGTLVDPPATAVNAVGSNVVSMLIARVMGGKNWMQNQQETGA
ncbi:MAG TPA: dicarboxylate/amino acid:cation symporter [Verrucomicrobiae bacterium]|nr:dicarboxylate/amino acid:cation symporter [Verrucomicrobiae bacterium]